MTQDTPDPGVMLLLGEIKGTVEMVRDGQAALREDLREDIQQINTRIDALDNRLRLQEQRSAAIGGVSGGVMGIGTALIVEGLKAWFGARGGQP